MEQQWVRFIDTIKGNYNEILFVKSDNTNDTRYAVQEQDDKYIVVGSIPNDINSLPSVKIPIYIFNQVGIINSK